MIHLFNVNILFQHAAPPKPPSPKPRTKAKIQPQRPPAPKIDLIDVNYVEDSPAEPLYAKVKKDQQNIRPER